MKEIKFRVFDKRKQKMLVVDTILLNEKMFKPINGGEYDVLNYNNEYYSELMQYTGLKDKNGIDIYEGDIAKYGMLYTNYEVRYFRNSFVMWSIYGDYSRGYLSDDVEIIGNIYENPELLEKVE